MSDAKTIGGVSEEEYIAERVRCIRAINEALEPTGGRVSIDSNEAGARVEALAIVSLSVLALLHGANIGMEAGEQIIGSTIDHMIREIRKQG